MKLIGITGGIGAGKTTVSNYLTAQGYTVLDADRTAKELLAQGSPMLHEISRIFGKDIVSRDFLLDRKKLADQIFADPAKKEILDSLMHGKILEILQETLKQHKAEELVFIDAALLFEAGWDSFMDQVIVVDADLETRIHRVLQRDPLSREEVLSRIRNQMSTEERNRKADFILNNSLDEKNLYHQIDRIIEIIKEK